MDYIKVGKFVIAFPLILTGLLAWVCGPQAIALIMSVRMKVDGELLAGKK